MADTPIYRVTYPDHPEKNRPANWGERDYYYNCSRTGGNYSWFKNNLSTSAGSPKPKEITADWTFDGKWNPESKKELKIVKFEIHDKYFLLYYNEPITVIGKPELKSQTGKVFIYNSGAGSDTIRFDSNSEFSKNDLFGLHIVNKGKLFGTKASINVRQASLTIK